MTNQIVEGVTDEEARITVIETSTGEKLTGENAPKKGELEEWLKQNPGYEVFEGGENESGSVRPSLLCLAFTFMGVVLLLGRGGGAS